MRTSKSKPKPSLGKKIPPNKRMVEFVLQVRSTHPSLPAPVAAAKLADAAPELAKRFKKEFGDVRVQIERRKTFPIDPATVLLSVGIFVGLRIAGRTVDKMYDATVGWAQGKLKGARVTKGKERKPGAPKTRQRKT